MPGQRAAEVSLPWSGPQVVKKASISLRSVYMIYDIRRVLVPLLPSVAPHPQLCKATRSKDKMRNSYRAFTTGLTVLSSYILVTYFSAVLPFSQPNYLTIFALLWIVGFLIRALGQIFLYPTYFSPLRHLPGPKGGGWWCGHFLEILRRPSGEPMKEWQASKINRQ